MAQAPRPLNSSASARHYFGSELRRLRQRAGLSQDALGRLIRYSGDTVSKVEKAVRWPRDPGGFAAACDRVLDGDGTLARLVPLAVAERGRRRGGPAVDAQPRRASFPGGTVDADAEHALPLVLDRPADIVAQPDTTAVVGKAEDDRVLGLFLDLQDQLGGDDLYLPLAGHTQRLSAALRRRASTARLPALGRLSQMAGWLAMDSNRHAQARTHLTTALAIAHEVDDAALAASALAYMSLQQVYLDDHGRALSLARTAADMGGAAVTPRVAAMLGTRLARAHARLGHQREALAALDDAHLHLGRSSGEDEPLWISYVDDVEVTAQAGACYLDLGMTDQAEGSLRLALGLLDRHAPQRARDRVHYLSRLAKTSLRRGDVDEACVHADQALLSGETVGSARVLERLGEVAAELAPFVGHPAARETRERISALTGP